MTFFWNGNVSGYFNEELETYVEIPSDKACPGLPHVHCYKPHSRSGVSWHGRPRVLTCFGERFQGLIAVYICCSLCRCALVQG